jgi:hypothetical protein
MKNRTAVLCILASMVVLLFIAGAGLLQSASPPKATGGVWFTTIESGEELHRHVEFQVHDEFEGQPDKGMLNYRDSGGTWLRVDVDCVSIDGDHAFFSGVVVSASDTSQIGYWLHVAVYDGGSPGSKGDQVWGEMFDYDPGCDPGSYPPGGPWDVEKGNLVVHPGSE